MNVRGENMAAYEALTKAVKLENLTEGQTINRLEYIKKLKFFNEYDMGGGTYIVDKNYKKYGEIGLHYYKYTTLIKYFSKLSMDKATIKFVNGKLCCD